MEYRNITLPELAESLGKAKNTLILFHRNPDADAVGSAFALRMILEQQGSRVYCICESEVPKRLAFLMRGMQESTREESIPAEFQPERIVSVDTASPNQLGGLAEHFANSVAYMIDHHGVGERYADGWIEPKAAASGEMIFDLMEYYQKAGRLTVTPELKENLYAAISSDTGCFRYSNVTPATHLRAAKLIGEGMDAAEINQKLFDTFPIKALNARAEATRRMHLYENGRVAVITFPYELKKQMELEDEHLETLVDIARSAEGVKIAIAIRQPAEEGVFRVSVRSGCLYDVSELCGRFGGGGHVRAAGCTVRSETIEQAEQMLVAAVDPDRLC